MKRRALSILVLTSIAAAGGAASAQGSDELNRDAQQVIAAAPPIHIQATITGIDPSTRMVTLRGPHRDATVLVDRQVTNFDQLRVGDKVDVLYKNALLVTADKVTGGEKGLRKRVDTQTYSPASEAGGVSGFESSRRVEVLATVEKIDRKQRTVTLRGPWGTETLDYPADFDAQQLKKGDTVHAVFVSAAAVRVTPADAANAAK
ncbi:hypothetical protein P9255_08065 [Caballeronia sp. LZ019]|nr:MULTISPECIES: hypothetical protein [unclassified Caballeronia]MDR5739847.1 hypothetical protein [Caballeronia sp. LZ016]MDR5808312.1 hypothetical protein [Caballeronia sp. LZ019]